MLILPYVSSTRTTSDASGSSPGLQLLFDAALQVYEKQAGMKLIDQVREITSPEKEARRDEKSLKSGTKVRLHCGRWPIFLLIGQRCADIGDVGSAHRNAR
jgi:hypothetical protein